MLTRTHCENLIHLSPRPYSMLGLGAETVPADLEKLLNVPAGKPAGQTEAAHFSAEYPQSILAAPSLQHEQSFAVIIPATHRDLTHKESSTCSSQAFYESLGLFWVKLSWL